jgi:small subunit ribosomal protein S9
MAAVLDRFYGTGRRKTSVARVWIKPGAGRIVVNRRAFEDYFPRETLRMIIAQPLQITNTFGQFDLLVTVAGGGPTGQAGAVRHGLARALARFDEKLRSPLKKAGLLTRDPRMRERKKYGQPGARQKFQYSKR